MLLSQSVKDDIQVTDFVLCFMFVCLLLFVLT